MDKELQEKTLRRGFIKKIFAGIAGAALAAPKIFSQEEPKTTNGVYPSPASGMDPFLGEIALFAFDFAPTGWYQCNGQLLPIQTNQALFALLGTYYGGNGVNNFALPDLRGKVVISQGQGPGLPNYNVGQTGGEVSHVLTVSEIPVHNHSLNVSNLAGTSATPQGNVLAKNSEGGFEYSTSANTTMNPGAVANTGSGSAHNNMQPYLAMNYCIAYQGIFPSRP